MMEEVRLSMQSYDHFCKEGRVLLAVVGREVRVLLADVTSCYW